MSNKYHNTDTAPSHQTGGTGGGQVQGRRPVMPGRDGTADWPGLPGKASKSRAAGTPERGYAGPFRHKKEGM